MMGGAEAETDDERDDRRPRPEREKYVPPHRRTAPTPQADSNLERSMPTDEQPPMIDLTMQQAQAEIVGDDTPPIPEPTTPGDLDALEGEGFLPEGRFFDNPQMPPDQVALARVLLQREYRRE